MPIPLAARTKRPSENATTRIGRPARVVAALSAMALLFTVWRHDRRDGGRREQEVEERADHR